MAWNIRKYYLQNLFILACKFSYQQNMTDFDISFKYSHIFSFVCFCYASSWITNIQVLCCHFLIAEIWERNMNIKGFRLKKTGYFLDQSVWYYCLWILCIVGQAVVYNWIYWLSFQHLGANYHTMELEKQHMHKCNGMQTLINT